MLLYCCGSLYWWTTVDVHIHIHIHIPAHGNGPHDDTRPLPGWCKRTMGTKGPRVANRKAHARKSKSERKKAEVEEIQRLRVEATAAAETLSPDISKFSQLPISQRTKQGLEAAHFLDLTDIQKSALPVALAGSDVLGAAKTGSGKTLAFLVPLLEKLYRENWSPMDGLGALVLSPTRELALQTFEVLRRIGKFHTLSAGLVIGGKDLQSERSAIGRMNILVATPGRLLQHLDQTMDFDWSNLQMLVLDEADRILDLGFAQTLNAIVAALPKHRQTLLFSATQTDSVSSLARLSLRNPVEVSVHAAQPNATPDKLEQTYLCCPLEEKFDRLYSFIKGHLKKKTIVFFSSCKEVRFVYEAFCRLQPGVPLLHLHGRQKQPKRVDIFQTFCRRPSAVLFATDVAARGLDFPAVDWVVQADCPEDVETYIHRVGRTARLHEEGRGLLFLLPSEKDAMLELLQLKKIPIKSMYPEGRPLPPAKRSIGSQLQALCSQDPEIKYLAQKAVVSYVRSVHLNSNKSVFKVAELPIERFAASLGLAGAPKLRFVARSQAKNVSREALKTAAAAAESEDEDSHPDLEPAEALKKEPVRKIDRMFRRKNVDVYSEHYARLRDEGNADSLHGPTPHDDGNDEDDFLRVRRRDHEIDPDELSVPKTGPAKTSRRDILKTKKKYTLKNAPARTHLRFSDEEDTPEPVLPFTPETQFDRDQAERLAETFVEEERSALQVADREDAERTREMRRKRRAEKKQKQRDAIRNAQLAKVPRLE